MKPFVQLSSEIGALNTVILHRPGLELEHLIPPYLEYMLSEDTPHVATAGKEHDAFADLLRKNGTQVLYLADLFLEVLQDETVRRVFVEEYCEKSHIASNDLKKAVREYLFSMPPEQLRDIVLRGIMKRDLTGFASLALPLSIEEEYPFITDPLCGIYFTRDIGVCIGRGMLVSSMSMPFRQRETLLVQYIWQYHPLFQQDQTPKWYDNALGYGIEGGDVLVLSDRVLAIGYSERTSLGAVEALAHSLFSQGYEKILLFHLPKNRRFMHLDVLFTMVDRNKFLITPALASGQFAIYELSLGSDGRIKAVCQTQPVKKILAEALELDEVTFISVGGGDVIYAPREHWNMGSNVLTIAPGKVVAYDRNDVTNEQLVRNGVEVLTFSGCELSRGRGGPRCMSMPVHRERL
jgi:arginine deiminase